MKEPKQEGYYKVVIDNIEMFAYYSCFYGWMTFSEPTSWRHINYEPVLSIENSGLIYLLKY